MVNLDILKYEELQNYSSSPPKMVLSLFREIIFLQCISVLVFRPTMKNHQLQTYSFLNACIHFKVHIFLTTTTMLSPQCLTLLNSQLFPLQSHCGCTPQYKETKPRLHKANDNAMFKAQEFSRSINSQQRPSAVSLPTMLKPRLASPCLLRLFIRL